MMGKQRRRYSSTIRCFLPGLLIFSISARRRLRDALLCLSSLLLHNTGGAFAACIGPRVLVRG